MYRGTFKDIDNNEYVVEIIPKNSSNSVIEITLSSEPVVITRKSDNLFSEIKPLGCTIEILTDKIYPDMYSSGLTDVEVNVYASSNSDAVLFTGYLTPYVYTQPYAHTLDVLQLEAVSKLSILKDISYFTVGAEKEIVSFQDLLWHIMINGAGYDEENFVVYYNNCIPKIMSELFISEANFFDDDDAQTPWTMEEVLVHICRYLNLSCVDEGGFVYLLDYQHIAKSTTFPITQWFNKETEFAGNSTPDLPRTITKDDHTSDDATISYDEIYNAFEAEINAYNIEELAPDLLTAKNSHYFGGYMYTPVSTYTMTVGNRQTDRIYVTQKLMNTDTNWKHYFYRMKDGTDLTDTGYEEDYYGSNYNYFTIPRINKRCAIIKQMTTNKLDEPDPAKLDFTSFIAFHCLDDTVAPHGDGANFSYMVRGDSIVRKSNGSVVTKVEQPVLEYTSDVPIKYCPETGVSWITIKGDLWYQGNWAGETNTLYITNALTEDIYSRSYTLYPWDGLTEEQAYRPGATDQMSNGGQFYQGFNKSGVAKTYFPSRTSSDENYGKGWPMLKCSLQIGDYYWDADYQGWTTQPATFYINYNNSPKNGEDETFNCLAWQSVAPNITYEDKVQDNCWAIPIKTAMDGQKVTGKLKLTLYTPSQLAPMYDNWSHGTNWQVLFPVIYMRGFELNYVYTDDSQWWTPSDQKDDDIVYKNTTTRGGSNKPYPEAIEFKINSYADNVPISKSYVMTNDKQTFLTDELNDDTRSTQLMEYHYIEKMLNHYKNKKLIYETTIKYNTPEHGSLDTRVKHYFDYSSIDTFKNGDGTLKTFVVDSYTHDVKNNNVKVKFIEW